MDSDDILREEYLGIIENQINDNDPIETKKNFERLVKEGFTEEEAKAMLIDCIAIEIFDVIKNGKFFNKIRYVLNLSNLPTEPKE